MLPLVWVAGDATRLAPPTGKVVADEEEAAPPTTTPEGDLLEKDPVVLLLVMVGSAEGVGEATLLPRPVTWVGAFRDADALSSWLTWVSSPRSRELDLLGEIEALTPASPPFAAEEELELPPPMLLLLLRFGLMKPPLES